MAERPPVSFFHSCPGPPLAGYVQGMRWLLLRPPMGPFTVVSEPSACSEIVITRGAPMLDHHPSGLLLPKPDDFLFGPMASERGATVQAPTSGSQCARVLSIVLMPGVLPALLREQASTLRDTVLSAEQLPRALREGLTAIVELQDEAAGPPFERVSALLLRVFSGVMLPDPRVRGLLRALAERPATALQDLVASTSLSARQAERHFARSVGFTPKELQRLYRFRAALERIQTNSHDETLSRLASQAGYADQAHLSREFRSFTGTTPSRYAQKRATHLYLSVRA